MRVSPQLQEALRYPPFWGAASLLGMSLLIVMLTLVPWWLARATLEDLRSQQVTLEAQRQHLESQAQLAHLLAAKRTMLMAVRQKVDAGADPAQVMERLQMLAEQCEVRVLEHKALDMTSGRGPERYSVRAQGNYGAMRRFLAEISPSSPRLTVIRNVRLAKATEGALLLADIELATYSFGEQNR